MIFKSILLFLIVLIAIQIVRTKGSNHHHHQKIQTCPNPSFATKHICPNCSMQQAKTLAKNTNSKRPPSGRGSTRTETIFIVDKKLSWTHHYKNNHLCITEKPVTCFVFTKSGDDWTCQRSTGYGNHNLLDTRGGHFNPLQNYACTKPFREC